MSSIFGQPEPKPNPFGGLGNPSTSTSAGQTNATTGGSNFFGGGLGATNSQSHQSSSLFGTNNSTNNPPPAAGFSINVPQQTNPPPSQDADNAFSSVYFNNLLEKGRKRKVGQDGEAGFGEVPSLQFGLGDIAKRVRELGGADLRSQQNRGADSKAHYLLAASGVNLGTTRRDLDAFGAQPFTQTALQQPPDWDPDSNRYIEQLQQQSTLKMISEGIERAHRNFDAYLEENIDIDWEDQRRKIYEHFGLAPRGADASSDSAGYSTPVKEGAFGRSTRRGRGMNSQKNGQSVGGRSIFGASGMQKSVIGTPGAGQGNAALFADVAEKTDKNEKDDKSERSEKSGIKLVGQDDRFTREKQGKFAEAVQRLNGARLEETVFPVLQEFANVEKQCGGESSIQLVDAYKALTEIVKENPNAAKTTDPDAVKSRQYAEGYLDETPNSASVMSIRKRILDGSRRCLEKQFYELLESSVAQNPRDANLGGIPTVTNKVRAYIRIRAIRKDLTTDSAELQRIGDDYCWALVFFLLRSGFIREATEYVTGNQASFRVLDRNFVTFITNYASSSDRRLSRSQQDRINSEYQQRTRLAPDNSLDPYRIACYKIVGRCELSKRNFEHLSQQVEDWMWLQFSLAREVNRTEEVAGEVFGLDDVQETIREIGDQYFSKESEATGGHGTYFFLQILGGMFEQAIAFLYPHSYVSAVHFAIALDFYGLLRVSDFSLTNSPELLTYTTKKLPQISFGRMLGYYTTDFRSNNAQAAADYLALICLNADLPGALGQSQLSLCHEALRELVLETREFAALLGDIWSDGTRFKGAIEQRLPLIGIANQEEFLRTVTIQAASVADDNGRTTDAVLLYHLAEDYDNVTAIINRALSDSIALDIGQGKLRLQPLKPRAGAQDGDQNSLSLTSVTDPAQLAFSMITLYNENALYYQKIRPTNREACGVLLQLSNAKGKVEVGQWAEALDIISSLSLLPLNANSSIPIIRSHAQTLTTLPSTISRLIGPLLLWTITCIGKQRDVLSTSASFSTTGANEVSAVGGGGFDSETKAMMREELVGKARDLMVFAGLIKLRLGAGVWEALVAGAGDVGVY